MTTTYRWYILETTVPGDSNGPFAITSWSRTKDAARAKVDKADPKCELLAFKVFAATRQQAIREAAEVFGVKVVGYISPEDKRAGRQLVKAAVMREIFCPYTGDILDMRRAVVVDSGYQTFVCAATHWDKIVLNYPGGLAAMERANKRPVTVYDGRELFK
jgi:hypothetical protein